MAEKSTRRNNHSKSFEGSFGSKHATYTKRNGSHIESVNSHNNSCEDKDYIKEADKLEEDVNECF